GWKRKPGLEPGVEGMCRIRACLIGLQNISMQSMQLRSSRFEAVMSAVRTGLPVWLDTGALVFSTAGAAAGAASLPSTTTVPVPAEISRLYLAHGLVEAVAIYFRAAVASASEGKPEGWASVIHGSGSEASDVGSGSDIGGNIAETLKDVLGMARIAINHYRQVVHSGLTAMYEMQGDTMVGHDRGGGGEAETSSQGEGASDNSVAGAVGAGTHSRAQLAASLALLFGNSSPGAVSSLSALGFNSWMLLELHTELELPVEGARTATMPWHRRACISSMTIPSRAGIMSGCYQEPEGTGRNLGRDIVKSGSDFGSGSRAANAVVDPTRQWEFMMNEAVWCSVLGASGCSPAKADAGTGHGEGGEEAEDTQEEGAIGDGGLKRQGINEIAVAMTKLCVSARNMVESIFLVVNSLVEALATVPSQSTPLSELTGGSREKSQAGGVGRRLGLKDEHLSGLVVELCGEVVVDSWLGILHPFARRALQKLVHHEEGILDVEKAWEVRRMDTLIRMATSEVGTGSVNNVLGLGIGDADWGRVVPIEAGTFRSPIDLAGFKFFFRVCSQTAASEGLDCLLKALQTPLMASHVLRYYSGSGRGDQAGRGCAPGVLPTGEASTLTNMLSLCSGVKTYLPKALAVVRAALECVRVAALTPAGPLQVREGAKPSGGRSPTPTGMLPPLTVTEVHPIVSAVKELPSEAISKLVDVAVQSASCHPQVEESPLPAGTPLSFPVFGPAVPTTVGLDALVVLALVLGYPNKGRRPGRVSMPKDPQVVPGLGNCILDELLERAGLWVGTICLSEVGCYGARLCSEDALGRENNVTAADLALWLASRQRRLPELLRTLVLVAKEAAEQLGASNVDGAGGVKTALSVVPMPKKVIVSLACCLRLVEAVLRPACEASRVGRMDCSGNEEGDTLMPDTSHWLAPWGIAVDGAEEGAGNTKGVGRVSFPGWGSRSMPTAHPAAVIAARRLAEMPKVCTFAATHMRFVNQHWYHCYTCGLVQEKGCCSLCVRVCHRGHMVAYARRSCFFCDCGGRGEASPSPSLEGSPASSSAGVNTGTTSTGAGGPSSPGDRSYNSCMCLKERTSEELSALIDHPGMVGCSGGVGQGAAGLPEVSSSSVRGVLQGLTLPEVEGGVKSVVAGDSKIGGNDDVHHVQPWGALDWTPGQINELRSLLLGGGEGVEAPVGETGALLSGRVVGQVLLADLHVAHSQLVASLDVLMAPGRSGGNSDYRVHSVRPWESLCLGGLTARKSFVSKGSAGDGSSRSSRSSNDGYGDVRSQSQLLRICSAGVDSVLVPARLLRNGTLDVRLMSEGARARQDKAIMAMYGVVRCNLAADSLGRVAMAESQNVMVVDPVGALALRYMAGSAMTDSPADRSHLCVVSKVAMGFDVIGLAYNPANERHLVVWGLRQCSVVVTDRRGTVL
ncbi:unnamed protein product, partial [Choristocarpus tenellus]